MSPDFEICPVGTHRRLAQVRALEEGRVIPFFRPSAGDIALLGQSAEAFFTMPVESARAIHAGLGEALRLADCKAEPLSAVEGTR